MLKVLKYDLFLRITVLLNYVMVLKPLKKRRYVESKPSKRIYDQKLDYDESVLREARISFEDDIGVRL